MGSKAVGKELGLRLFLEGIELPVVAAQVQSNINGPATASIQIVPSDRVLEFKPRTLVHLFFKDFKAEVVLKKENPVSSISGEDLRSWKLLFGGEIIGVTYSKNPLQRQAVLQCADWSTYWDTLYQMMYSPGSLMQGSKVALFGGGSSVFDSLPGGGHAARLVGFLKRRPITEGLKNVKGLMGGIIHMLEIMGGVPNHTSGVNDFFTIAELRLHLLQQIAAEDTDDTASRLASKKQFMQWLSQSVASLGELVTFRDMLKLMFKYIYYESVPISSPMYVPGSGGETSTVTKKTRVSVGSSPLSDFAKKHVRDLIRDCDKIASTVSTSGDHTNLISKGDQYSTDMESLLNTEPGLDLSTKDQDALLKAKIVRKHLENAQMVFDAIVSFERQRVSSNKEDNITVSKYWKNAASFLRKALAGKSKVVSRTRVKKTPVKIPRLFTQVFRPDCFFAAPPKCNVLFPDQVTQFTYSRNFMQEITRLRLSSNWLFGISSGLLKDFNFAPDIDSMREIAGGKNTSQTKALRHLLPWEKFTGIIPKFEHVSELNHVDNQMENLIKGGKAPKGKKAAAYLNRAANFNYFKYRFAARTASVMTTFNPYMICGFPGAVIDRPFIISLDDINEVLSKNPEAQQTQNADLITNIKAFSNLAPTQFLGMVAGLSHSVDQSGGNTSLTMVYAREHRVVNNEDFLNGFIEENTKKASKVLLNTVLDASDLIDKGDRGLLSFLIDSTPQQGVEIQSKQIQDAERAQAVGEESEEGVEPSDRVTGAPTLEALGEVNSVLTLGTGASFAVTSSILEAKDQTDPGIPTSLRGKVKRGVLPGGNTSILIPDKPGLLTKGKTGPKGGTIVAIQVLSDGILKITAIPGIGNATKVPGTFDLETGQFKEVQYMWRRIVIWEEKDGPPLKEKIPLEELIRPRWLSPLYSNFFIGPRIYQPFFGCDSVIDQVGFQLFGGGTVTAGANTEAQKDLLAKIEDADGDARKVANIVSKAPRDVMQGIPDIESSLNVAAYVYGEAVKHGVDVDKFISQYTWRPIATLEDILGSEDLEYKKTGNKLELVQGTPGFHSTAVANFGELLGLLDNPDQELDRLSFKGSKSPVAKDFDPRPERRKRVEEYKQSVSVSSGGLGVGVQG